MLALFIDLTSGPNPYFILAMLAMFVFAVAKPNHNLSENIPTYLTTVGIIGTFFGLYWALKSFDSTNIDGSIPALLEGIKTKFLVSLIGISLSLGLKWIIIFKAKESLKITGSTLDDVVLALGSLRNENTNLLKSQNDSLILLRSDFSNFTERMAADNSKAFIEALENVIKDFNQKINDQFGDNFKQLNIAVGKLLDWQDKNKEEMNKIISILDQTSGSLESSKTNLIATNELMQTGIKKLELFNNVSSVLEPTLVKINEESLKLQVSISTFSQIANQAKELYPTLQSELNLVFGRTSDSLINFNKGLEKTLSLQSAEIDRTNKSYIEMANSSKNIAERAVTEIVRTSSAQIEKLSVDQGELIKKQLAAIDKGLEEELSKALESLGNNLASLSEKFVSDYGPLTDKLNALVTLANSKNTTN